METCLFSIKRSNLFELLQVHTKVTMTFLIPVHLPSSICSVLPAICSNLIHFPSYFWYFFCYFRYFCISFFQKKISYFFYIMNCDQVLQMAGYAVGGASCSGNVVMWPQLWRGRKIASYFYGRSIWFFNFADRSMDSFQDITKISSKSLISNRF